MENKKITEYIEVNDVNYFLKDENNEINIEELCRSIGKNRWKEAKEVVRITYFTERKKVSVTDTNIHKLIAPEAIEINCRDNNITEICAPKAVKIDCSYNPLEKVTAPNCKEINIKIISFGERKNPLKEDFILAEDCKITDTEMYFYKDEFYAFIKEEGENKILFPIGIDGRLTIDKKMIPFSSNSISPYTLETNAKYIEIKHIFEIGNINAPNAITIYCRGTGITELDLPKAKSILADDTFLRTINAPNAIFVACKNTSVKTLNLPLAESIDCEGCKHLEEVYAPNCTSIDFTDTNIKQGGLIIKGIKD